MSAKPEHVDVDGPLHSGRDQAEKIAQVVGVKLSELVDELSMTDEMRVLIKRIERLEERRRWLRLAP